MNKKYTVFLSSTYEDLREERNEVIQALLEMDCIPCSMEYFPSDDDEQFEFIKSVIDECDYYVLIIAGRYGSIGKEGLSFTEMEYKYAESKNIPIVSFVHNAIGNISVDKSEKSGVGRKKLEAFRKYVSKGKMVKYWNGKDDLAGKVSRTMISMIKRHPAVGWVRGNYAIDNDTLVKMKKLYEENIAYKENAIEKNKKEGLMQGTDEVGIVFNILEDKYATEKILKCKSIKFTWNELFVIWGKIFLEENRRYEVIRELERYCINKKMIVVKPGEKISLSEDSFSKVTIQFLALGLLEVVHPNHDNYYDMIQESRYRLTKDGEENLLYLSAKRKANIIQE